MTPVPERPSDRGALPYRWRFPAFLLLLLLSPSFLFSPEPYTAAAQAASILRAAFVACALLFALLSVLPPRQGGRPPSADAEGRGEGPVSGLEERNRDLLAHHRCTKRMLHARTAGAVYRELVEGIREGLGFKGAVLAYLDQGGSLVFPPAPGGGGSGFPGHVVRRDGGDAPFFLPLLDAGEPRFSPGPPAAGGEEYQAVCGRVESLVLPIFHRGWSGDDGGEEGEGGLAAEGESPRFRPAMLVLRSVEGGRAIGPATTPLVLSLLNEADTALEMADMYRKLRALSVTDGLTGLLNHREFYDRLDREVDRAKRYGHNLSLLILDVDDFKRYNDRFGHPAGDDALRVIASLLRRSARGTDLLARYGGEEFAVILPESSNAGAMLMAERIRSALAEANLSPVPYEPVHLTVSIGIYTSEAGGTPIDTIVSMADEAAYRAKEDGKNRVILRSGL